MSAFAVFVPRFLLWAVLQVTSISNPTNEREHTNPNTPRNRVHEFRAENQKKPLYLAFMEVSAPVKITDGSSNIIGLSYGIIPGSGECALISSATELFVYSITEKNVPETWTFPSNQKESLSSPAFAVNEEGYLSRRVGTHP